MTNESNQSEVGVLTSKVVQINAVQVGEPHYTHVLLYALCEDGSVWEQIQHGRKSESLWRMVQPPIEAVRQAIWAGNEILETN